jgi:hypothetical protein
MQLLIFGFYEVCLVKSRCEFKISELRSEHATGTGYIVQVAKQILIVPVLGKPPSRATIVVGWSHSPNTNSIGSRNESERVITGVERVSSNEYSLCMRDKMTK